MENENIYGEFHSYFITIRLETLVLPVVEFSFVWVGGENFIVNLFKTLNVFNFDNSITKTADTNVKSWRT